MIPKIAHWIWLYEEPPFWVVKNIEQFKRLHPGWTVIIWRNTPPEFPEDLSALMKELPHYASRSDVFRYWLLNRFGGVYLDCDNYVLKSLEPLLNRRFFTAPYDAEDPDLIACGLMGSEAESHASHMILASLRLRTAFGNKYGRTTFGPGLMKALFGSGSMFGNPLGWFTVPPPDGWKTVLPYHYFYLLQTRETAQEFLQGNEDKRSEILAAHAQAFIDGVTPYSVHLWGVNDSSTRTVEQEHGCSESSPPSTMQSRFLHAVSNRSKVNP